jgi:hypothetical protein
MLPSCRFLRVPCDLLGGQKARDDGIPRCPKPLEGNSARRNNILLHHVCLPDSTPVLLVARTGTLICGGFRGS